MNQTQARRFILSSQTMTDPAKFDDDWAELARELERDKPSSPPPRLECHDPAGTTSTSREDAFSESAATNDSEPVSDEFFATDEVDTGHESESDGESNPGDGQPGTGRKRRRRRRRRRKGGAQTADMGTAEEIEQEKNEANDGETEEEEFELVPKTAQAESGEAEYGDEPGDDFAEDEMLERSSEDMEEDAGGELLRELIANWNVPSWDDVVGGLYRPER